MKDYYRAYISEKRILLDFLTLSPARKFQFIEAFGEPEEGHLREWLDSAPLEAIDSFLKILHRFKRDPDWQC